jgi:hypothetical protein
LCARTGIIVSRQQHAVNARNTEEQPDVHCDVNKRMGSFVQERFPAYGVVVTTRLSVQQASTAIEDALIDTGCITSRSPTEYQFRLRWYLWTTPMIRLRLVPSVAGTNVYVRVADEGIWRVLHITLLLLVLGASGFWLVSGQSLPVEGVALASLCLSVCGMWWIGFRAVSLVREVLPE